MTQQGIKVTAEDGKVRLALEDGTFIDFLPGDANTAAGLFVRAAYEAVYNTRPKSLTMTFNFED